MSQSEADKENVYSSPKILIFLYTQNSNLGLSLTFLELSVILPVLKSFDYCLIPTSQSFLKEVATKLFLSILDKFLTTSIRFKIKICLFCLLYKYQ